MYKVMLVDDEPIIVEGLSRSIAWEKWNCRIVATAHDGLEGKNLIEKEQPDIVFMDICMPEMDGLAMIAAINSQFPNLEVCVLTGYRDFEYAKEAIRLGVTRFLLKPSNMDELEEALSKKDITQEQFNLAIETSHRLQQGFLSDISSFTEYTRRCYEMIKKLRER